MAFGSHTIAIASTIYDEAKNVVHVPASGDVLPAIGDRVSLILDWAIRYRNMRAHTMMHLLCACVPFPVTGGSISEDGGRIDFDIPEGQIPDREALTARINQLITENHAVTFRWITDEEMEANLHLVRTMSVKPPMGTGRVRLVMIGDEGRVDLQPCGGTHVHATGEIGPMRVAKIENKGKINRRIRLAFA
jgi:misacylated tRNA(Ala) deacylase